MRNAKSNLKILFDKIEDCVKQKRIVLVKKIDRGEEPNFQRISDIFWTSDKLLQEIPMKIQF